MPVESYVNLGIHNISGNQGSIMADVFATQKSAAEKAVQLSGAAAKRVADLIKEEQTPGLMLRVTVSGGGCSGFQYGFNFDDTVNDGDRVFERDGIRVVVDDVSLDLLDGSEIDFVEDLIGASFRSEEHTSELQSLMRISYAVFCLKKT